MYCLENCVFAWAIKKKRNRRHDILFLILWLNFQYKLFKALLFSLQWKATWEIDRNRLRLNSPPNSMRKTHNASRNNCWNGGWAGGKWMNELNRNVVIKIAELNSIIWRNSVTCVIRCDFSLLLCSYFFFFYNIFV